MSRIRIGISACLLGQEVRFDGGHKRDPFLTGELARHVEWVPVCPEVEVGMGTPREAVRLWQHAKATGADVVFGHYETKQHSGFRNFGSWLTNRVTDWALDKPPGFYLSSFRCVNAFIAQQVVTYAGPGGEPVELWTVRPDGTVLTRTPKAEHTSPIFSPPTAA